MKHSTMALKHSMETILILDSIKVNIILKFQLKKNNIQMKPNCPANNH